MARAAYAGRQFSLDVVIDLDRISKNAKWDESATPAGVYRDETNCVRFHVHDFTTLHLRDHFRSQIRISNFPTRLGGFFQKKHLHCPQNPASASLRLSSARSSNLECASANFPPQQSMNPAACISRLIVAVLGFATFLPSARG